jgi:hypothetical protein
MHLSLVSDLCFQASQALALTVSRVMEDVDVQLSPPAAPVPVLDDISQDEVFQSNPDETELVIRRSQKQDSNTVIQWVRFKPLGKSRFSIPLCRLRCLPLVRPVNDVDVARLENEFVMGYRDGDRAMYVSIYNNLDEVLHVSDDIKSSWSPLWQEANVEFDATLQRDPDLAIFVDKMFYVWEGNHRLTAWLRHINNHHPLDKDWHISADCIVVDPRNCTALFLNAMNDINW